MLSCVEIFSSGVKMAKNSFKILLDEKLENRKFDISTKHVLANNFALLHYSNNIRYCCNDFAILCYLPYRLHSLFICDTRVSFHLPLSTSDCFMITSNETSTLSMNSTRDKQCIQKIFEIKYFRQKK